MSLKPRQSVLNLFDPLLSDALRVPLPNTPPLTPTLFDDLEGQEDSMPADPMELFFSGKKDTFPSRMQRSGLLVNIEEEEDIEVDELDSVQKPFMSPTTESQISIGSTIPHHSGHIEKSAVSYEVTLPLLVLPDSMAQSSTPIPPSPPEAKPHTIDDYLNPLSQSHSRRRSSIDISRTLSSFSSSLLELPGSNVDLIKEELSPLSAFSEEEDSLHCSEEKERLSTPVQEAKGMTTPRKPTLLSLISAGFENSDKVMKELITPEAGDGADQKQYLQSPSNESPYRVVPSHLSDTSNYQQVEFQNNSKMPSRKPMAIASLQSNTAISAPKRSKVFTLNRQHTFKPITTPSKSESAEKATSLPPLHRPMRPPSRESSNAPVKGIPRLHKPAILPQVTAPESKIPSRIISPSENINHLKISATTKTFGGPSRIAVPLKRGVPKTMS